MKEAIQNKEQLVAIITRTKNRPLLLNRALLSVKSQSYKNFIHIIINDSGDEEQVKNLVNKVWQGPTASVHVKTIHSGGKMEAASNEGLNIAKEYNAIYVVIHDDDDSWTSQFLHIMVQELLRYKKLSPTIRGIVCQANRVYESIHGNIIRTIQIVPHISTFPKLGILNSSYLLDDCNNFAPIQFLYELDALCSLKHYSYPKPYNTSFKILGDWDFNIRFLKHFDIATIPNYLAFYHHRSTGSNVNSMHGNFLNLQVETYKNRISNELKRNI